MIIKIWRYQVRQKEGMRPRTAQKNDFDIAFGCASYIAGLSIEPECVEAFENALAVTDGSSDARRAGDYIVRQDDHDVAGILAHGLGDGDIVEQIQVMAVAAASAGLEYFFHYTWSHRDGEMFAPYELARQNRTIRHVLEASGCPSLEAYHREKRRGKSQIHGHGNLLSVDQNGVGKPLAHSWYREAAHLAIAVVERDDGLRPEPMRRYIATDEGVFGLFTGVRVADRSGRILRATDPAKLDREGETLPDGGLMARARRQHQAVIEGNDAPDGYEPGDRWPLERFAKIVIAPRIQNARNWQEVHRNLAPLGIRYTVVGNTGRLIAIGENGEPSGEWVGPGAAYTNAAIGKLSKRFKADFEPSQGALDLRPLTMPVFNRPDDASEEPVEKKELARQETAQLKPEIEAIERHLADEGRRRRKEIQQAKLGKDHNPAIAAEAVRRRQEEETVREFAIAKGARRTRRTAATKSDVAERVSGWRPICLIIWGAIRKRRRKASANRRAALDARYDIRPKEGHVEYWLRGPAGDATLAFVESDNLITVRHTARRVNIDALEIASEKYERIRIAGTERAISDSIKIAAELDVVLEDNQTETGLEHRKAVAASRTGSILEASRRFHKTTDDRARTRQAARRDRKDRDFFTEAAVCGESSSLKASVAAYLNSNQRTLAHADDTEVIEARRSLDEDIDHDRLFLASSRYHVRYQGHHFRFLDDVALTKAFSAAPELLIDRELQDRLRAIEAIQLDKRRIIAAAIVAGAASIGDGELSIDGPQAAWAQDFWKAQRSDPTFQRLIAVAWARPDRFTYDESARPGERSQTLALQNNELPLAKAIARQMLAYERINITAAESNRSPMETASIPSESAVPELPSDKSSRTETGIPHPADGTDQKPPERPRHLGPAGPDDFER
ncbi:hypothetical protein [Aurantiacibacter rhizosphaerae]|uniref:Large polyvalent protein-associated domain-containing protein n=1 Tax=Aurantiacibacter rhizosphaerae TaxID=2691582 RepID=A0A844XB49_9SPHN|nr:hypothetical protein [Aurantiacibacter rhizosphaerae]MWV26942.1 hypothetical protein [Aurantiacibacter rhizosphaerae]